MNVDADIHSTSAHTPLVLIVDDDVTSTLMLSKVLGRDGYQIVVVKDGQAALDACQTCLPDIILMDAIMPLMDGFTCCKTLKNTYADDCPPILMITGLNDSESVDHAFEVGATDYVPKPFHWAVLRQRVRRTISAHINYKSLQKALAKERSLRQELRQANHTLHHLATTDGLTQIANRRVFDERLRHEWKRLRREQSPLGLILFDIDCFKAYNDTYGHLGGDECLQAVAQIIQNVARRPADLAARYGGEEFALILPNTHLEGAVYLARRVRQQLKQAAIPHTASTIKPYITLSMGVTSVIPNDDTPQSLVEMADQALYKAKQQGRDRLLVQTQNQFWANHDQLEPKPSKILGRS
ncbi:MAG: PleD family two-component system response regulator [Symploca sp. SIO2B6]|nr:PleD family two-component system response regulator [Symploca sp. SIO2B6]